MSHNINVLQQTSLNVNPPRILILKNELLIPSTKRHSSKMTRVHNPPPVAVARRNARERNRVKQVNNGFATLRQHIPSTIAAAYESGSGRSGNKKLSKVETLRMAVEYIKSLEKLLNISEDTSGTSSSNTQQYNITYTYSKNEDRLKQIMFEDEENIHPLKTEDMDQEFLQDTTLVSNNINAEDMSLLHSIDNTASLSPEVYSEHSLSPVGLETNDTKSYIPVFNVPNQTVLPSFAQIAYDRLPQVKTELLSPSVEEQQQTVCVIRTDGEPIDVIWWDQQQPTS